MEKIEIVSKEVITQEIDDLIAKLDRVERELYFMQFNRVMGLVRRVLGK